ncbi:hypothetical protein FVE85_5563 [Porphyridium purpureum]|uniref:Phosphotyrosine protein phosphatase I domain-containing protein n=1 Tax=Porphyridium purpureum TaxID=35688 RepID=A0A5J4Z431_PORPP|nr:hypothetical protein FVE85_5563 [Porphyridium purpureum]|eukprot:POR1530..scf295_1
MVAWVVPGPCGEALELRSRWQCRQRQRCHTPRVALCSEPHVNREQIPQSPDAVLRAYLKSRKVLSSLPAQTQYQRHEQHNVERCKPKHEPLSVLFVSNYGHRAVYAQQSVNRLLQQVALTSHVVCESAFLESVQFSGGLRMSVAHSPIPLSLISAAKQRGLQLDAFHNTVTSFLPDSHLNLYDLVVALDQNVREKIRRRCGGADSVDVRGNVRLLCDISGKKTVTGRNFAALRDIQPLQGNAHNHDRTLSAIDEYCAQLIQLVLLSNADDD